MIYYLTQWMPRKRMVCSCKTCWPGEGSRWSETGRSEGDAMAGPQNTAQAVVKIVKIKYATKE